MDQEEDVGQIHTGVSAALSVLLLLLSPPGFAADAADLLTPSVVFEPAAVMPPEGLEDERGAAAQASQLLLHTSDALTEAAAPTSLDPAGDSVLLMPVVDAVATEPAVSGITAADRLFNASLPRSGVVRTFEQMALQTLHEHPAILAKRSSSDAARADLSYAEWQRFPAPAFSVNRDERGNRNTIVTVQQPLWAGGRITSGIASAESRYGSANSQVQETEESILISMANAYAEALRWQAHLNLSADNLKQHLRLTEMMQRRVKSEVSPAIDLELAQGRLYQAENEHAFVQQMLKNALTQLTQLSGITLAGVIPPEQGIFARIGNQAASVAEMQEYSPVLARMKHDVEAAQAEVGIKESVYWPQLSLRYEKQAGPTIYNVNRLMVAMDMQLGAGFSSVSATEAARARLEAALLERDRVLRELTQQVTQDWDAYSAARTRVETASSASGSSALVFDSYARQYAAGRKSWLDVMNAVREANQSKGTLIDAYGQMVLNAMRLLISTGKLNVDKGVRQ